MIYDYSNKLKSCICLNIDIYKLNIFCSVDKWIHLFNLLIEQRETILGTSRLRNNFNTSFLLLIVNILTSAIWMTFFFKFLYVVFIDFNYR